MKDKRAALIFEKNPQLTEVHVNPKGDYYKKHENALASVNGNEELLKTIKNPDATKQKQRIKSETPDDTWTRDEVVQELKDKEIEFDGRKSKADLLDLLVPQAKPSGETKTEESNPQKK